MPDFDICRWRKAHNLAVPGRTSLPTGLRKWGISQHGRWWWKWLAMRFLCSPNMFRDPETQSNVQGTLENSRKRWPSHANDGYMMSQSYCNHFFVGMTILWCGYPPVIKHGYGKIIELNVELCLASFDYWYYWCTWWPNDPGCVFTLSYSWVASCCVLPTSPLSLWRGRGVSPCLQQGLWRSWRNGWFLVPLSVTVQKNHFPLPPNIKI